MIDCYLLILSGDKVYHPKRKSPILTQDMVLAPDLEIFGPICSDREQNSNGHNTQRSGIINDNLNWKKNEKNIT